MDETRALVAVWSQENVQGELDSVARNRTVYERIAKELAEMGYEKTWKQCRTKIKNLTQKYRKVGRLFTCSYGASYWSIIITFSN